MQGFTEPSEGIFVESSMTERSNCIGGRWVVSCNAGDMHLKMCYVCVRQTSPPLPTLHGDGLLAAKIAQVDGLHTLNELMMVDTWRTAAKDVCFELQEFTARKTIT